jgi:hypothetical protein
MVVVVAAVVADILVSVVVDALSLPNLSRPPTHWLGRSRRCLR